jgi:hypothetical protein
MPKSKGRRTGGSRDRKVRKARAIETQAAQRKAERRKLTPRQYAVRRAIGWTLVGLGVAVFVQHLVSHAGFFTLVSPGVDDVVAGYPLAAVLGIGGVVVLSR